MQEAADALMEHIQRADAGANYDLISGITGCGIYGLERSSGAPIARETVRALSRMAETNDHAATWKLGPKALSKSKAAATRPDGYNLGLAHGIPGVVAFLACAAAADVEKDDAASLARRALSWLSDKRQPFQGGATFAMRMTLAGEFLGVGTRTAWCYGDAGVSAALYLAGKCLEDSTTTQMAKTVALSSASPARETAVRNPAICHGGAGLALIYQRFFVRTGDRRFAAAAERWTRWTVDHLATLYGHELEVAAEELDHSLLSGLGGIVLVLLSMATEIEPAWDRILLLS